LGFIHGCDICYALCSEEQHGGFASCSMVDHVGLPLTRRLAAGAVGLEPVGPVSAQDRIGQDAARRIAAAEEQGITGDAVNRQDLIALAASTTK
tara:strand:+ start:1040 stop:1321 length:282 start_codon:yes stop_codon:yes gene_type:complete